MPRSLTRKAKKMREKRLQETEEETRVRLQKAREKRYSMSEEERARYLAANRIQRANSRAKQRRRYPRKAPKKIQVECATCLLCMSEYIAEIRASAMEEEHAACLATKQLCQERRQPWKVVLNSKDTAHEEAWDKKVVDSSHFDISDFLAVCSSGEKAYLHHCDNPSWLPALHLDCWTTLCTTAKDRYVSPRELQDREDVWHRTLDKSRARQRKHSTFEVHSTCTVAEEDHHAIFCQKHLAMPAASVLLHDYDGAVDSSTVVVVTDGLDDAVEDTASMQRTGVQQRQLCSRMKRNQSQSRLLCLDSNQTEAGGWSNSQQESLEPDLMSAMDIEIDIADDPPLSWMREASSQGHCRSAVPHVQVITTAAGDEYNCQSALCEEEELFASNECNLEIKQEKDWDVCTGSQVFGTKQFHMFEHGMEIKQERNLDVHQDNEDIALFHGSELCMEIKQEKDTDVGFGCESFISEQFQTFDY